MLRSRAWKLLAAAAAMAIGGASGVVIAEEPGDSVVTETPSVAADPNRPLRLMQNTESVYDLEAPPQQDVGVNEGGVNFDLRVSYLTDYVFRGLDRSEGNGNFNDENGDPVIFDPDEPDFSPGAEDAANLQVNTRVKFDLGRVPGPFIGLFANVYNDDPINRFQEIRPYVGLEWMIRPLIIAAGQTTYIYPERDDVNTAEVWAGITLDDSFLFNSERPVLSPYIFAAYDYDLYDGTYVEAGLKHEIIFEDTPITLTFLADVAFVANNRQFTTSDVKEDTGFQHYDIGVIGRFNLNTLFNVSRRYGTFHLEGYLYYTDGIDDDLLADTQLWGGVGIGFRY
jgi:hypothetical protein